MQNLKIGLFGIGLDAYWPQFDGLKQQLESYITIVEDRLKKPNIEVRSIFFKKKNNNNFNL